MTQQPTAPNAAGGRPEAYLLTSWCNSVKVIKDPERGGEERVQLCRGKKNMTGMDAGQKRKLQDTDASFKEFCCKSYHQGS